MRRFAGQASAACAVVASTPAVVSRRGLSWLYSSKYGGARNPAMTQRPAARLRGSESDAVARAAIAPLVRSHAASEAVAASADAAAAPAPVSAADDNGRRYVPLTEVAMVELQGDYCTEGGLHAEALAHYGVACRAYDLAYPAGHEQLARIRVKLAAAFCSTGRLCSAKALLQEAIGILVSTEAPPLEVLAEAVMQLGLCLQAAGDADAGAAFEDAAGIVASCHDLGASHRMLRGLHRWERRLSVGHERKFRHFSPFDFDRTFAIADQTLSYAEVFYRARGDAAGVLRALEQRSALLNRKAFNARDTCGKIERRGGAMMRFREPLSGGPSPTDLLTYSPTIHQVYRDWSKENTVPITFGEAPLPMQGSARRDMDDGDPLRRVAQASRRYDERRGVRRGYDAQALESW